MFVHYHETWKCFLAFPTNLTNRPKCVTLGSVDTIMICEFCEVIFLRSRQKFAGVLSHGKDF